MIDNIEQRFFIEEDSTENTDGWYISFDLNKKYHFEITTQKTSFIPNRYKFELFVDEIQKKLEFTKIGAPIRDVVLYASDPWEKSSFNSSLGTLEHFTVITKRRYN